MANLGKVIYINEEDYSTLLNGGSITKGGTTYTYDSTALYVIKNVSAPEYAETAGYATEAGRATTAERDGSGNNIAATYDKKPLVIEVNGADTTVPSGTYDSITAALAAGRDVIVKSTFIGSSVYYYRLIFELTSEDEYYFRSDNSGLAITSSDTLSRFASAVNPHFHGNIQSNGTLQTTDITIANGDKLVVTDTSNSNRISRASLTFDGSTTTQALSKKGTWETFYQKPSTGIPETDLESAVQTSLGKADTSVQKITSTDNAIARFDGTGGQIQNSSAKVTDDGDVSARNIIIHGSNTSNDTRIITSDSTNNIYVKIGNKVPLVANETEVRSGSSAAGTINLGTSSIPWNNVYAKKFITQGGTSSQFVKGDGSLDSTAYWCNGQYIASRRTSLDSEPTYIKNFGGASEWIGALKVKSGYGDFFYCAHRKSKYTVTSNYKSNNTTVGEYTGEDVKQFFTNNLSDTFMLPVANLETTPWVLTIQTKNIGQNYNITATDVLNLCFFQHNGSAYGYLNSYKIEVLTTQSNDQSVWEWFTVYQRTNVEDRLNGMQIPIWYVDNIHGASPNIHNYGYICGVRITVSKADATGSWSAGKLPISGIRLLDMRPSHTPASSIGALDVIGGTMYGDIKFDYGTMYVPTVPVETNDNRAASTAFVKNAVGSKVDKITSTDNAIARFDGTGGQIQNSGVTINDSNHVTAAKFITSGGTSSQFVKGDGSLDSVVIPQNLHVKLTSATSGGTTTYSANYTYEQILTSINNGGTPDLEYDAYIYRFDSVVDTLIMFSKIDGTQVGEDNQDKLLEHTFCVESNNTWTKETREIITTASSSNFGLVKLTSSFRSTDDTLAATAHAVKRAYDHGGVQSVNGQTGAVTGLAPLASPALTGTPTAPTAASGTNTTQIATTAFVQNALSNMGAGGSEMVDVTITGTISSASFSANPYNAIKVVVDDGKIAVLNASVAPLSTTGVLIPVYEYTYSQSGSDFTGYKGKIQNGNYEISVDVQSTSSATVSITSVGSSITVDTALSESSTNPVQNRVITAQILENEEIVATALNNLNDRVELKQDQLVSGTTIKTINNQSILGSGNINISGGGGGSGEENVIEIVKVNGTALTPDANKAVNVEVPKIVQWTFTQEGTFDNITWNTDGHTYSEFISAFNSGAYVYVTIVDLDGFTTLTRAIDAFIFKALLPCEGNLLSAIASSGTNSMFSITEGTNDSIELSNTTIQYPVQQSMSVSTSPSPMQVTLKGQRDEDSTIQDTGIITVDEDGVSISTYQGLNVEINTSSTGKANYNGNEIATVNAIPDSLADLTADSTHRLVTDTEKSTWNGKYSKPSGGIPKTDLATAVQTSLGKADTALQPDVDNDLEQGTISSSNSQGFDYIIANKDTSSEQTLQDALDAKASISAVNAKYTKPAAGIPDTDLTTAVNVRLLAQLSSGSDDGKIMKYSYSGGGWQAVKPVTIYSGSSAPSSSTGSNGDIYIQTS